MTTHPVRLDGTAGEAHAAARPVKSGLIARLIAALRVLAAAGRVARAVEHRREPARGDLDRLGIAGRLPALR